MQKAHLNPLARQLCDRLGINLPRVPITGGGFTGITAPIRRLVTMGEDTPPNFKRLFGQEWQDAQLINDEWWAHRFEVLQPYMLPGDPAYQSFDAVDGCRREMGPA
jgi:hypothetical protein